MSATLPDYLAAATYAYLAQVSFDAALIEVRHGKLPVGKMYSEWARQAEEQLRAICSREEEKDGK